MVPNSGTGSTDDSHSRWFRNVSPLLVPGAGALAGCGSADLLRRVRPGTFGPREDRERVQLDGDIEDLEGLRRALKLDTIVLYGQSYGGWVAQAYVLRYPKSVSKLILANTLHSAEMWQKGNDDTTNEAMRNQFPEIWAELQQLRAKGAVSCDSEYQTIQGRVPLALFYFYNPSHALDFDLNNEVYCQIAGPDADVVLGGDLASVDFRRRLREIQVPTLILAGRVDRVSIPRYAVQFRRLMPLAEFSWFERSGHFPFIEEPERHDALVRNFVAK
jgi:proline iminopeptidase